MEIEQLELDLWDSLETAVKFPQTADLHQLCDALEHEIAMQPVSSQLTVVADVLVQLSQVYAERVELSLSGWERWYNPTEPVVDLGECVQLFLQSLHLDVADLFEDDEPVYYPTNRQSRSKPKPTDSLVGPVNKAALLAVLEDEVGLDDKVAKNQALAVAHDEDISVWVEAIAHYFRNSQVKSLPLVELVRGVQYPVIKGEEERSPLIKTWLALLLGGFTLKQGDDFYSLRGILVEMPQ